MQKQYCITRTAYIQVVMYADSLDEAKEIAEDSIDCLKLESDPDCDSISITSHDFYDSEVVYDPYQQKVA